MSRDLRDRYDSDLHRPLEEPGIEGMTTADPPRPFVGRDFAHGTADEFRAMAEHLPAFLRRQVD